MGILVQKQENIYILVINDYVLRDKIENFVVEIEDGEKY